MNNDTPSIFGSLTFKAVFIYDGIAYQKMADNSAFDPETKTSIELDFYTPVDYVGIDIWPAANSPAYSSVPQPIDIMAEQMEIGHNAGHQLSSFKKKSDGEKNTRWIATCAQCNGYITVWSTGLTYSILRDRCV